MIRGCYHEWICSVTGQHPENSIRQSPWAHQRSRRLLLGDIRGIVVVVMSQHLRNITPWISEPNTEALAFRLISPGLWPGETLHIVSWGYEPVTTADVTREAKSLANKALGGLRSLTARDVGEAAGAIAVDIAADTVLHAVGALESHQSVSEMGPQGPPVDVSAPPSKAGFIIALTHARLVFLDVLTCITHTPGASDPVRWYSIHRATPLTLPLPETLEIRFTWTRVLWERQLDLRIELPGVPSVLRFGNYEIARAPERARSIAAAIGRDPGP